ncbi:glycosyltransferase [Candidatus Poribacteria bacterium]|nr:glycosyltransferase [Candidatus Poribacteria bacterium]
MKLFLLSANYPPTKCGMADYAEKLSEYLKKIVHINPYIITSKIIEDSNLQIYKNTPNIFRIMKNWDIFENNNLLELIKKELPDIIHIQYHDEDFPLGNNLHLFPSLVKKYFPKIKIVTSLAGFDLNDSAGSNCVQQFMNTSDAITLTTDFDLNLILTSFPESKNKIFKVYDRPNIIYSPDIKINKKEMRKRFNVSMEDFLLINFGFINHNKGFESIFHALKKVIDKGLKVKLLIIGELHDGRDSKLEKYYNDLKMLSLKLHLNDYILWIGYLKDIDVSKSILCADAAIMPFRDGITGKRSSFWSVLDHGIPAITTIPAEKHLPDGMKNGKNVLLTPIDDFDSMSIAITKLANDKNFCKKIGDSGKELVNKKYSWEQLAKELNTIYKI